VSSSGYFTNKKTGKNMRTLQFAGVAVVFGILTVKTIRDIMKDMKEKSEYGYDSRRYPSFVDNDV
tara:strand:- start:466 stop:660 length:195 start_codon:yes stop_codon:yes gene_type:complete